MHFLSKDINFIIFPQGGLIRSLDPVDSAIIEIKIFTVNTSSQEQNCDPLEAHAQLASDS